MGALAQAVPSQLQDQPGTQVAEQMDANVAAAQQPPPSPPPGGALAATTQASGPIPGTDIGGTLNTMMGHMTDLWGQAKERLGQYDQLATERQAALQQIQQATLAQNKDPSAAFNEGWGYAMAMGRPNEALAQGMKMKNEQRDVNAQRQLEADNLSYTDITGRQKDTLELYKEMGGGAGNSGMMTGLVRGAMNPYQNVAGVGLVDKFNIDPVTGKPKIAVAANQIPTWNSLYGKNLAEAKQAELTNPDWFQQHGTTAEEVARQKTDEMLSALQTNTNIAGGAARAAPGAAAAAVPGATVAAPAANAATSNIKGEADFNAALPPIAPAVQAGRDSQRMDILRTELTTEAQAQADAYKKIQANKALGADTSDAEKEYQLRTSNVDSLMKELALANKAKPGAAVPPPVQAPLQPVQALLQRPVINEPQLAGDKERATNIAKAQQAKREEILNNSTPAQNLQGILNEVEQSASNLKGTALEPGMFAPYASKALQFVKAAGWQLSPEQEQQIASATDIQKLNSMLSSVATKQVSSRPGVYEFATFLKNNPSLDMTPASLQKLIGFMRNTAQVTTQLPADYGAWLKDHPRGDPLDFDAYTTSLRANPGYWNYLKSKGLPSSYAEISAAAKEQNTSVDTLMNHLLTQARKYRG